MQISLLTELLIILAAGLVSAIICRRLHLSVLIGYLVAGTLLGQGVFGWVQNQDHQLESFAEAGVFLLLFTIGLQFSLDDLKSLGRNMVVGGSTQMLAVAIPVGLILSLWGVPIRAAVLLAAAIAFSSTVLVFKALAELGHSAYPHGQRAIAILLFQDAALIPLLLMVPMLTEQDETAGIGAYLSLALTSILFVLGVVLLRMFLAREVIPRLAGFRTPELVLLFVLVALGGITLASYSLGLPPAVGAFAAGLIFNGNRWTEQIDALVLPFRETFAAVFFVGLGLIFDPTLLRTEWAFLLASLAAVIVIKSTASTLALRLTGLPWMASIGTAIGLSHIGEFAFVLILLGLDSGLVTEDQYQRLVAIAVGSLILTPPLIKLGLRWTGPGGDYDASDSSHVHGGAPGSEATLESEQEQQQAIVIGAGPIGKRVASQLETLGRKVCLVDLSAVNLHSFAQAGFQTIAGDAADTDVLSLAGIKTADLAVVSVPNDAVAMRIVQQIRQLNRDCTVIVRCRYQENAKRLRALKAHYVVSEETIAGLALMDVINDLKPAHHE